VAMTSCGWLFKFEPQKAHYMDYTAQGYCDNLTLTNKSAMDLRIARRVEYRDGEKYIIEDSVYFILKPNDVLDSSGISLEVGTKIAYSVSWKDWKQGDVIKYDLRCNDNLEPLPIKISYDDYKRERLYVYESKEAIATELDAIWRYWY
jgi:hypothetical protein